jgi:hypothetical protein
MRNFSLLCSLFISLSAFSETCPPISAIQAHELGEWRAFDADNGEPLTPTQLAKYENEVRYFSEAAYFDGALEGPSQCYYEGTQGHDHLNAYLARYALVPNFARGNWTQEALYAFCREGREYCEFLVE